MGELVACDDRIKSPIGLVGLLANETGEPAHGAFVSHLTTMMSCDEVRGDPVEPRTDAAASWVERRAPFERDLEDVAEQGVSMVRTDAAQQIAAQSRTVTIEDDTEDGRFIDRHAHRLGVGPVVHMLSVPRTESPVRARTASGPVRSLVPVVAVAERSSANRGVVCGEQLVMNAANPKELTGAMFDLLATAWVSYALHAAATLGIADVLAAGPLPASTVATSISGASESAVARLLRALVTIGLVSQQPDTTFALTPLGSLLRSDTTASLRNPIMLTGSAAALRSWGQLAECVRTGHTAAQILDGADDPFSTYAADPATQATFDAAMAEATRQIATTVARLYDFTQTRSVVDVGGGYGALLPAILNGHAELTATVFDRAHCREGAERLFIDERLDDRCRFVEGDFFTDELPAHADIYILKSVIHDWDDERSVTILQHVRTAMSTRSHLLVIEPLLPDQLEQTAAHRRIIWADLRMLIATGGRERTRDDYKELLARADLQLSQTVPTGNGPDIIEAVPIL
jgi:SAM-dependent methyltransferase